MANGMKETVNGMKETVNEMKEMVNEMRYGEQMGSIRHLPFLVQATKATTNKCNYELCDVVL
jgi:hypothetical protein